MRAHTMMLHQIVRGGNTYLYSHSGEAHGLQLN